MFEVMVPGPSFKQLKKIHLETEEIDFLTSADYSDFTFGPPGGGHYTTTLETTVEVITTTTATTGFTDLYTDSYSPCILQIVYKDELCGFGKEYKGKYQTARIAGRYAFQNCTVRPSMLLYDSLQLMSHQG